MKKTEETERLYGVFDWLMNADSLPLVIAWQNLRPRTDLNHSLEQWHEKRGKGERRELLSRWGIGLGIVLVSLGCCWFWPFPLGLLFFTTGLTVAGASALAYLWASQLGREEQKVLEDFLAAMEELAKDLGWTPDELRIATTESRLSRALVILSHASRPELFDKFEQFNIVPSEKTEEGDMGFPSVDDDSAEQERELDEFEQGQRELEGGGPGDPGDEFRGY